MQTKELPKKMYTSNKTNCKMMKRWKKKKKTNETKLKEIRMFNGEQQMNGLILSFMAVFLDASADFVSKQFQRHFILYFNEWRVQRHQNNAYTHQTSK